jgi:hypothetical protein
MEGKQGIGRWPTGAFAALTVERFDAGGVIIHRVDSDASIAMRRTASAWR